MEGTTLTNFQNCSSSEADSSSDPVCSVGSKISKFLTCESGDSATRTNDIGITTNDGVSKTNGGATRTNDGCSPLPISWKEFKSNRYIIEDIRRIRCRLLRADECCFEKLEALRRPEYRHRQLKNFRAAGLSVSSIYFPQEALKHTTVQPPISYCINPNLVSRLKNRSDVLLSANQDTREILDDWLSICSSSFCHYDDSFLEKRDWYSSRVSFGLSAVNQSYPVEEAQSSVPNYSVDFASCSAFEQAGSFPPDFKSHRKKRHIPSEIFGVQCGGQSIGSKPSVPVHAVIPGHEGIVGTSYMSDRADSPADLDNGGCTDLNRSHYADLYAADPISQTNKQLLDATNSSDGADLAPRDTFKNSKRIFERPSRSFCSTSATDGAIETGYCSSEKAGQKNDDVSDLECPGVGTDSNPALYDPGCPTSPHACHDSEPDSALDGDGIVGFDMCHVKSQKPFNISFKYTRSKLKPILGLFAADGECGHVSKNSQTSNESCDACTKEPNIVHNPPEVHTQLQLTSVSSEIVVRSRETCSDDTYENNSGGTMFDFDLGSQISPLPVISKNIDAVNSLIAREDLENHKIVPACTSQSAAISSISKSGRVPSSSSTSASLSTITCKETCNGIIAIDSEGVQESSSIKDGFVENHAFCIKYDSSNNEVLSEKCRFSSGTTASSLLSSSFDRRKSSADCAEKADRNPSSMKGFIISDKVIGSALSADKCCKHRSGKTLRRSKWDLRDNAQLSLSTTVLNSSNSVVSDRIDLQQRVNAKEINDSNIGNMLESFIISDDPKCLLSSTHSSDKKSVLFQDRSHLTNTDQSQKNRSAYFSDYVPYSSRPYSPKKLDGSSSHEDGSSSRVCTSNHGSLLDRDHHAVNMIEDTYDGVKHSRQQSSFTIEHVFKNKFSSDLERFDDNQSNSETMIVSNFKHNDGVGVYVDKYFDKSSLVNSSEKHSYDSQEELINHDPLSRNHSFQTSSREGHAMRWTDEPPNTNLGESVRNQQFMNCNENFRYIGRSYCPAEESSAIDKSNCVGKMISGSPTSDRMSTKKDTFIPKAPGCSGDCSNRNYKSSSDGHDPMLEKSNYRRYGSTVKEVSASSRTSDHEFETPAVGGPNFVMQSLENEVRSSSLNCKPNCRSYEIFVKGRISRSQDSFSQTHQNKSQRLTVDDQSDCRNIQNIDEKCLGEKILSDGNSEYRENDILSDDGNRPLSEVRRSMDPVMPEVGCLNRAEKSHSPALRSYNQDMKSHNFEQDSHEDISCSRGNINHERKSNLRENSSKSLGTRSFSHEQRSLSHDTRSLSRDRGSLSREKKSGSQRSLSHEKRSRSREKKSYRGRRSCSRENRSCIREKKPYRGRRSCSREKRSRSCEKKSYRSEMRCYSREKRSYRRERRSDSRGKRSCSREKRSRSREKRSLVGEKNSYRERRSVSRGKRFHSLKIKSNRDRRSGSRDKRSCSREKKSYHGRRSCSRDRRSCSREKKSYRGRRSCSREKISCSREKKSYRGRRSCSREKRSCSREKKSNRERRSCSREKRSCIPENESCCCERRSSSRDRRSYSRERMVCDGERQSHGCNSCSCNHRLRRDGQKFFTCKCESPTQGGCPSDCHQFSYFSNCGLRNVEQSSGLRHDHPEFSEKHGHYRKQEISGSTSACKRLCRGLYQQCMCSDYEITSNLSNHDSECFHRNLSQLKNEANQVSSCKSDEHRLSCNSDCSKLGNANLGVVFNDQGVMTKSSDSCSLTIHADSTISDSELQENCFKNAGMYDELNSVCSAVHSDWTCPISTSHCPPLLPQPPSLAPPLHSFVDQYNLTMPDSTQSTSFHITNPLGCVPFNFSNFIPRLDHPPPMVPRCLSGVLYNRPPPFLGVPSSVVAPIFPPITPIHQAGIRSETSANPFLFPPPVATPSEKPHSCDMAVVPAEINSLGHSEKKRKFFFPVFNRMERKRKLVKAMVQSGCNVATDDNETDRATPNTAAVCDDPDTSAVSVCDDSEGSTFGFTAEEEEESNVEAYSSVRPLIATAGARSILVVDGFLRGRTSKQVSFLDGYRPGEGSSSDDTEMSNATGSPVSLQTSALPLLLPSSNHRAKRKNSNLKLQVRVIHQVATSTGSSACLYGDDCNTAESHPAPPEGRPPNRPYYYLGPAGALLSYMRPVISGSVEVNRDASSVHFTADLDESICSKGPNCATATPSVVSIET